MNIRSQFRASPSRDRHILAQLMHHSSLLATAPGKKSVTATLPFRNPSDQAVYATVSLYDVENEKQKSSSSILMRTVTPDRNKVQNYLAYRKLVCVYSLANSSLLNRFSVH